MGDSKCHHDEATLSQTEEKRAMSKVLEEYPAYITESRSNFFSLIIPHTEVISAIFPCSVAYQILGLKNVIINYH